MTTEEFIKYPFKSTTLIEYTYPEWENIYLCRLCEVDFDEEILTIAKLNSIDDVKIQANIKHCNIHHKNVVPIKKLIV